MVQFKSLSITNNKFWHVANKQMYEDLEVPFLAHHIRALIVAFNSKLVAAEERLIRQIETHLRLQQADESGLTP